jgi:hypothetical protein
MAGRRTTAIYFNFPEDCECASISGAIVKIPKGSWPVAEADSVSILIGARNLTLEKNAFLSLKVEKKAIPTR